MTPDFIARENLRRIVREYRRVTGKSVPAVSKEFYGNADFLGSFLAGRQGITLKKMGEVIEAIRVKWPAKAAWPYCQPIQFPPPPARKISPEKSKAA